MDVYADEHESCLGNFNTLKDAIKGIHDYIKPHAEYRFNPHGWTCFAGEVCKYHNKQTVWERDRISKDDFYFIYLKQQNMNTYAQEKALKMFVLDFEIQRIESDMPYLPMSKDLFIHTKLNLKGECEQAISQAKEFMKSNNTDETLLVDFYKEVIKYINRIRFNHYEFYYETFFDADYLDLYNSSKSFKPFSMVKMFLC